MKGMWTSEEDAEAGAPQPQVRWATGVIGAIRVTACALLYPTSVFL